jgi:hypothetical protein
LSRARTLWVSMLLAVFALPVGTADARRIVFGERVLHQGMRGTDVRVLQDYLTKAGLRTKVDGRFGPQTKRQVRRWEKRSQLPVNGRVTRRDAATLRSQVESGATALQEATGGVEPTAVVPAGAKATIGPDGKAIPPIGAPPEVVAVIEAANEIVGKPYKYGGGHKDWKDSGYDCSGSESYALHGAGLVSRPLNSTEFMRWGEPGEGEWITSYAHSGHSFLVVAGLRFDTGYNGPGASGPRWSTKMRPTNGFVARHPKGL